MFGYVRINKPELKVKEYEAYRGLYCSLCKAIGKYFGPFARLTLSYDITFLVLARLSVTNTRPCFKAGRCPFNPAKRCNYCTNAEEELKYAACISVMLFYHKVKDDILDSSLLRRLLMYLILPYASLKYKKARKLFPEIGKEIAASMERQCLTEKSLSDSTDRAAHESANALGLIFSHGIGENKDAVYRFGYGTGKWVYLCDAADDMRKDLKKGGYNVFLLRYGIKDENDITEEILSDICGQLNMSSAFAYEAFGELEEKSLKGIVENILIEGTEEVTRKILKGNSEK